MVDPEGVAARVERLAPLLGELESIREAGREAYAAELRTRLAAEHAIHSPCRSVDVGAHLIAELGLDAPSDYRAGG